MLKTLIKPQNSFQFKRQPLAETKPILKLQTRLKKNRDSVASAPFNAESWLLYKIVSALVNEIFIKV